MGRMRACRSGWIAVVVACTVVVAVPAADAAVKRCPRGQFDRGGRCTSEKTAVRSILGITRSLMATEDAKGVIVRVDIGSRTLINRGLGVSMEGVPVSPKMNFRVGAMSIPFQTTIALQLQDERRLDLDDRLSRWFPQFPNADSVTLRMLASSTSGYPDTIQENPPSRRPSWRTSTTTGTTMSCSGTRSRCRRSALPARASTTRTRTSSCWARCWRRSRGVDDDEMRERFLEPLKMRDTRMSKLLGMPQPVLHAYSSERGVYEDSTYWSPSWGIGRGVLMTSTARDMIKGIRAVGTGKFVSRSGLRQLLVPYSRGLPGARRSITGSASSRATPGGSSPTRRSTATSGASRISPSATSRSWWRAPTGQGQHLKKSISGAIFGAYEVPHAGLPALEVGIALR